MTGASSGIGEAMAREFAAQGARVDAGCAQRAEIAAHRGRNPLARAGRPADRGVDASRTSNEPADRSIETAVNEFGGIDVLVCNAGLSMRAIFDDVDLGVLHRLMDVNFWGTVNCCKFALPYLQRSRELHRRYLVRRGAAPGLAGRTGYSASKYAMTGLLETLRIENLEQRACTS